MLISVRMTLLYSTSSKIGYLVVTSCCVFLGGGGEPPMIEYLT